MSKKKNSPHDQQQQHPRLPTTEIVLIRTHQGENTKQLCTKLFLFL